MQCRVNVSIEATCVRGADFNTDTMTVARSTAPVRSFDPSDYLSKSLNSGDLIIEKSGGGDKTNRWAVLCSGQARIVLFRRTSQHG